MDFDFGSREDQVTKRTTDASTTNSQALKSSAILHLLDEYNDPIDVIVAKKVFLVRPNLSSELGFKNLDEAFIHPILTRFKLLLQASKLERTRGGGIGTSSGEGI